MTKPGSIAHDATGEGHGKLVRNILDAKNEMEAQVRAPRNSGDSCAILAQFWCASLTADPSRLQAGGGRGDRDRQAGGDDDEGGGIILGKKAGKNVGGKQINAAEMEKIRATIQARNSALRNSAVRNSAVRKIECGAHFWGAQICGAQFRGAILSDARPLRPIPRRCASRPTRWVAASSSCRTTSRRWARSWSTGESSTAAV